MMKWVSGIGFVFFALVMFFVELPFARTEEMEMTTQIPAPPETPPAYVTGASKSHAPVVRVYKDTNAWFGENRDTAMLAAMGKILGDDWFVHPVVDCQKGIPPKTAVVFFTSNGHGLPSSTSAQNHPDCQAALDAFVRAGGALIVDMGDNDFAGGYRAPGAIGTPAYLFPFPCADATLAPQAYGHLIVKGPDGIAGTADDLTNANIDMIGGCWVSHGHLGSGGGLTLPSGATPLMTATFSSMAQPILAEYRHGNGLVILDTITKEFSAHQPTGTGPTFFLTNLLHYAMSSVPWPSNHAPILSFVQEEGYQTDGVNPNKGTANSTMFALKAVYTDADNNLPSYTRAVVDSVQYAMNRDETAALELRDNNYANGEQYTLADVSPKGVHTYYFEASDEHAAARLPASGTLSFEAGYSNVAFLPGLEASRLYKRDPNCLFFNCENRLWEPNWNEDVKKLYLNENGESKDPSIYTRDVIDEAFGFNVYKKFINSMNKLVSDGVIAAWQALPYDWRRDQIGVANESILLEEGKTYQMLEEIEKLAQTSETGKVTFITHSNGGLVGKALIDKLEERGEAGIIDRVIMVAAPQIGTPEAIMALLHGGQRGFLKGLLPSHETTRELGENMQSAYNLLPSRSYFNVVDTNAQPIIEFSATAATKYLRNIYGNAITGFDALLRFLTGEGGVRTEPSPANVDEPNVLSPQFLDRAQTDHSFFDSWTSPAGIEVIQIAGWGLDTLRGIRYEEQRKTLCNADLSVCSQVAALDPQPLFTEDGDKTVVVPSVTAMEGQKFYVNLPKHNQELFLGGRRNREHSDILEADELQDLIKDIIQDDDVLSSHRNITPTQPPPNDVNKKLRIRVHSPVSLDLYDAEGNHTGILQNPNLDSDIRLLEEEIPNSYYLELGEGKYAGSDTATATSIVLKGQSLGTFTLEIDEVSGNATTGTLRFQDIPIVAGSTITMDIQTIATATPLQIDLNGDGVVDFALSSSTSADSGVSLEMLARIIQNMDIKNPFKKELVKDIERMQKHLQKEAEHGGGDEENNSEVNEDFLHFERDVRKFVKKNILSRDDGESLLQIIGTIQEGVIK